MGQPLPSPCAPHYAGQLLDDVHRQSTGAGGAYGPTVRGDARDGHGLAVPHCQREPPGPYPMGAPPQLRVGPPQLLQTLPLHRQPHPPPDWALAAAEGGAGEQPRGQPREVAAGGAPRANASVPAHAPATADKSLAPDPATASDPAQVTSCAHRGPTWTCCRKCPCPCPTPWPCA